MRTKTKNPGSQIESDQGVYATPELFKTMLDKIPDGVIILDKNERITYANQSLSKISGYSNDELIGNKYLFLFRDAEQKLLKDLFSDSCGNDKNKITTRLNTKSGEEADAEVKRESYFIDDDTTAGHYLLFRFIKQEDQIEETLRQSEQKYREMTNFFPTVIYESDLNGRLVFANKIGMEMFGFTEGDIEKGINIIQLIAPQDQKRASDAFSRIFKNNIISNGEYLALKKTGETFNIHITSNAVLRDGLPVGIRGNVIDITDRYKADEAIRNLASIVESSDDAIIGKTLDGIVSIWNKGAENIYGYFADEIIGKPLSLIFPEDRSQEEILLLNKIKNGEHVRHFETVRKKKDGTDIDVSVTLFPILSFAGGFTGIGSITRDMTEKKSIEKLQNVIDETEKLLKSEEKFSKAFHSSPIPVCITTLFNPQVIEFNSSFQEQTGYTKDELNGRLLMELPFFQNRNDLKMINHNLTSSGFIRNYEMVFVTKNGKERLACYLPRPL